MNILCGDLISSLVLRRTPEGNLIAEQIFRRQALVGACKGRNFSVQKFLSEQTEPSQISPEHFVLTYEYCRPTSGER